MKRQTAKEILAESFRELAEKRPIDRITVKDIVDNCGYSSATFYRQFSDKYALIAWEYTQRLDAILAGMNGNAPSFKATLTAFAASIGEHKPYLANLFLHTGGLDAFIRSMREIHYARCLECVRLAAGEAGIDKKTELLVRIYCLGTVQLTCEQILAPGEINAEELSEAYRLALPEPLRLILSK
ncbi:MAG: TetR family transcriptional regulator [Pyramidobacter sp.]|nr:TetR family transcriptional regulator [Pyramidobacter sp.]MBR1896191.1 TetR family transcriptional regulator [Pyramidobacter sp.]